MNLTLNLSPELEQYLLQSAQRRGISVEEVGLAEKVYVVEKRGYTA